MHKFPNGKMYIGITSKRPKARWQNGTGYSKEHQSAMYNAIQKYGWDNIEHKILFKNLTEKEAKNKEVELIKEYHTFIHYENSNGYNLTLGGEGSLGHKSSKKVSETNRNRMLNKKGDLCPNSQSVICDNIRYESITEFCNKNNLSRAMVERWLKGEVRLPKEWLDKNLRKENEKDLRIKEPQPRLFKERILYNNIIYNSQRELAEELNVSNATLCNWLSGKTKIPNKIKDNGISFLDRENKDLISYDNEKRIEYDGNIYNSQVELALFLNVKKATLNSWLRGKNKIPKIHKEKGLKYYNK